MKVERSPEPLSGLISISLTTGNQSTKMKSIFTKVIMPVGKDNLAWIFSQDMKVFYFSSTLFSNVLYQLYLLQ